MERALGRRQKRNVLLLGDPGVGKTALVEALAQRIASGKAPGWLLQRRICALDVGALTAGTRLRGDFEERFRSVLAEAEDAGVVLFIDEAHTLVGAGATASSPLSAADMLKPSLARGSLQCIAATTFEEYRVHFARDPALERRFELVELEELTPEETFKVLEALSPQYEKHHGVRFTRDAVTAAADWSARHLPQRRLPDKAIDVADRAAVLARGRTGDASGSVAPSLRPEVTLGDVATAIEETVGLRPGSVSAAEAMKVSGLEAALAARVQGQSEAVRLVATAVARAKAGLNEEGRPIASLLLHGPPGVGKTSLATSLAEVWLGSRKALIRIDCASAASADEVGASLSAAVRRRPYSVVLVDEADKASTRLLDLLLEVLEEGSLSARGPGGTERADFRHALLLLTSNATAGPAALPRALADRLDGAAAMGPLSEEALERVLDGLVADVQRRLRRSAVEVVVRVTEAWRRAALAEALDGSARLLRRVVRGRLEDPLAATLLGAAGRADRDVRSIASVVADVKDDAEPLVHVVWEGQPAEADKEEQPLEGVPA